MKSRVNFRRFTQQENMPILLVLLFIILAVYLVEFFFVRRRRSGARWRSSNR